MPYEHLPPLVKEVKVRWIARDTFFAIKCQKLSEEELKSVKVNGDDGAQIRKMVDNMNSIRFTPNGTGFRIPCMIDAHFQEEKSQWK